MSLEVFVGTVTSGKTLAGIDAAINRLNQYSNKKCLFVDNYNNNTDKSLTILKNKFDFTKVYQLIELINRVIY